MRKIGMRLLAVLLAVVMVLPSLLIPGMAAEGTGFADVPEGSWYESAVEYVSEKGYMTGVGEEKFAPAADVTRAMFVTVLSRLAMAQTDASASVFADVTTGKWYTGAIAWAAEKGIVNGVGENRFAPMKAISRQDLCTILYRFVNVMGYELKATQSVSFTDAAAVSGYAADAVRFAASVGLIAGYDDGSFRPQATATRAQTAVIVMRLAQLLDGQIVKPEPMPAQSFNQTADQMKVSVTAPEGALPEGTKMSAERVTAVSQLAYINSKISGDLVYAADITFTRNGTELEPAAEVEVELSLSGLNEMENPAVVHVLDDGSVEHVRSEMISTNRAGTEKALRFRSKNFSVYAIINDDSIEDNARLKVQLWKAKTDGSGYEIDQEVFVTRQDIDKLATIIPDGETPTVASKELFCGWYFDAQSFTGSETETRYTKDDADGEHTMSAARAQVRAYLEAKNDDNTYSHVITDGETTVNIYPMIFYYFNVSYVDENGETTLNTETYYLKNLPDDPDDYALEVDVQLTYAPYLQDYRFLGWQKDDGDERVYENGEKAGIKNTATKFRAQVQQGYWLSFEESPKTSDDRYKGATYNAPVFCPDGNIPADAMPTTPHLAGYTFDGWYEHFNAGSTIAQDEWTDPFNFSSGSTIKKDTPLYARWKLNDTVPFTIIVWKQNIGDDKNLDDSAKTYDYAFATTKQVAPNTPVADLINKTDADLKRFTELSGNANITVDGTSHNFYGFTYNDTKGVVSKDTKVKPDGTTVVNLYYDRDLITVTYMTEEYTAVSGHPSTSSGTPVYFIGTSDYGYCPIRYYNSSNNNIYIPTTSNSGTQYAVVNGVWYELEYLQNSNTGVYSWYYTGSDNKYHKWDGTRYTYYGRGDTTSFTYYTCDWAQTAEWTGLYDQPVSKYNYTWSTEYRWMDGDPTGNSFVSLMDCFAFSCTLYGVKKEFNAYVYHFLQDENGDYETAESNADFTVQCNSDTDRMVFREFSGFNPDQYRVKLPSSVRTYYLSTNYTTTGSGNNAVYSFTWDSGHTATDYHDGAYWTDWIDNGVQVKYSGIDEPTDMKMKPAGGKIEFRYERVKKPITFMYGKFVTGNDEEITTGMPTGQIYQTAPMYFETSVDSYKKGGADYYDPVAKGKFTDESYIFLGWFSDPGCTTPYDFADKTMLQGGITVYAGFKQIEYRVFLHVNEEGKQWSDVAWNDPDQQSNFRISYNGLISDGDPIEGKMNGYVLVGWYTDEDCTQPFNFSTRLTDALGAVAQPYGAAEKADPRYATESDGHTNNDVDRPWINHMVHLYAKWRKVLDGATGITVVYDAIEQEDTDGKTGKFTEESGQPTTWKDPLSYTDQSNLIIRSGSTPDLPADYQFEYWEVLDKDGKVVKKIHPGMLLEMDVDWAKVSDAPGANTGNAAAPVQQTRGPVRAATDKYAQVNTPEIGHSYLIGYASGSDVYLIGNTSYYTDGTCPNSVSVTVEDGEITGDYGAYTWTVGGSASAMTFNNATAGYLGILYASGYYAGFGSTNNTWSYTNKKLVNTTTVTSYKYLTYYSGDEAYDVASSGGSDITFFEKVENLGEPITYTKVDTPVAGYSYVIVADGANYALSGTNHPNTVNAESGKSYLNGVQIERSGSNVIVYSNQAADLTWTAGGNATNGWTWQNVGNSKYLTYTVASAAYLTVKTSSTPWQYTNDKYFYCPAITDEYNYLSFHGSNYYYTVGKNGQAIGLYAKTHTLTINYVMPDGSEAPAAHVETVPEGVAYSVASPELDGYTADQTVVSGSMGTQDVTVTVTYTVDSHTVTFNWHGGSSTQTVNDGEYATAPADPENYVDNGITYIFTRWDPQPDATPITSNQVFTAQYKREGACIVTFKDWNGRVLKTEEVTKGNDATAPAAPTRSGFTFNGWDKAFTNVQTDLVVYATYKTAVTKIYTVTLRAVYGPKENLKDTHVTWYANNGSAIQPNVGYKNSAVTVVNAGIAIENSTSYPALTREGYTFLGWARMPEMADQVATYAPSFVGKFTTGLVNDVMDDPEATPTQKTKIVSYEGLDEDDLWLVYHPAEGNTAAYFSVRENNTELNNGAAFTQIAANENDPYHGLYAVWAQDVFYVVHSSTGLMEAIPVPYTFNAETHAIASTGPFNLADRVTNGTLYGGYYSSYGGVDNNVVNAIAAGYTFPNVAYTATASGETQTGIEWNNTNLGRDAVAQIDLGHTLSNWTHFSPYTGNSLTDATNGNAKFWTYANAYKAAQATEEVATLGTAMTPVAGTVYYLKEVPNTYLPNRMIAVRESLEEDSPIQEIFLFTAVDDANYQRAGFQKVNGADTIEDSVSTDYFSFSKTYTMIYKGENGQNQTVRIDPHYLNKQLEGGFVVSLHLKADDLKAIGGNGDIYFTARPDWITADGVTVSQNALHAHITADLKTATYLAAQQP